ncbi:hypothetical protein AALP_AA5G054900 [Arabis alpina]|uniref:Glycine-rich protein n=1 Tax=Arabis alpina TaxID=50452 RepID=A0A087GV46_ARAAL|nr:hypothetical protein AALP_AA5G054900 [Arabis alpina]
MASKTLILLGVFAFLLVVSEIAAASVNSESMETVQPDGYGGRGSGGGHKGGGGLIISSSNLRSLHNIVCILRYFLLFCVTVHYY